MTAPVSSANSTFYDPSAQLSTIGCDPSVPLMRSMTSIATFTCDGARAARAITYGSTGATVQAPRGRRTHGLRAASC